MFKYIRYYMQYPKKYLVPSIHKPCSTVM